MQSFARHTKQNGTLIQYMVDVTEQLLITHCNMPFECMSCQSCSFVDQVIELLNCKETMSCFDLYILLQSLDVALNNVILVENEEITTIDPALSSIHRVLPEKESIFRGPRPFCNHFNNPRGFLSSSGALVFHVTVRPDYATLTIAQMQTIYKLPDLLQVISDYILSASHGNPTDQWDVHSMVSTWNKFRIQLHSSF